MTLELKGRIDSNNASLVEKEIMDRLAGYSGSSVEIDAAGLEYISSAGLRILLRIRKTHPEMRLFNVSSEIYEILDMTGIAELMKVEKSYREISVENCEEIGRGANGRIYRIDQDTVVKVYDDNNGTLDDIRHERELARIALILGIPTVISYDVVKVGEKYGAVFELLNARSFSKILVKEPDKMDWCVKEYISLLKKIHGTVVPAGKLPDMKETVLSWASFMQDYLPEEAGAKLTALVKAVPHDDHMVHGDFHTKNVELQNDEVLLIDLDTLSVGHPIFELGSMFNAFRGFSELHHEVIKQYQGFDYDTAGVFWYKVLSAYLGTNCEAKIREVEDKARIVGYTRLIRRSIRRGGLETEETREEIEFWKERLLKLLEKTDTLLFSPNELDLEALPENLPQVQAFVDEHLEKTDCSSRAQMQIAVAVEEIFINIASYAYAPEKGRAIVRVEVSEDPVTVTVTFVDHGIPYDPVAKEDPRVNLPASEREIGGLGIFMTKKIMDDVAYTYKDGQNILTLKKNL